MGNRDLMTVCSSSNAKGHGIAMTQYSSDTTQPGYNLTPHTGVLSDIHPRPVLDRTLRLSRSLPVMAQNPLEVL